MPSKAKPSRAFNSSDYYYVFFHLRILKKSLAILMLERSLKKPGIAKVERAFKNKIKPSAFVCA